MRISVGYLYPGVMSTDGDRGNVEAIVRRCGWRNIAVHVTELRLGDPVRPGDVDIIMIGGGEQQQRLVAADLYKVKGRGIREAVATGAAALAVGAGYQLFGRFCQPERGAEFRGIELFDSWTIRQAAVTGGHDSTDAEARAERFSGELIVRWGGRLLVGFEDHSGATYLGPTAQPLGQVLAGYGNNGDGSEGVIVGTAIGTNLRGPCLPKNPAIADFLIGAAIGRRYDGAELVPLADELESAARDAALHRAQRSARRRSLAHPALRRPGTPPARKAPSRSSRSRRTWHI